VAYLNLTPVELAVVIVLGLGLFGTPVVLILLAVYAFNNYQTQRRSEVVDQALTRDDDIAPLPPSDNPAGTPKRT